MIATHGHPAGPRADACVEELHTHVGICQRTGYANGLADALDLTAALHELARDPHARAVLAKAFREAPMANAAEALHALADDLAARSRK